MRHISRTRRVNFDWIFDRINLDSGTQIKYVNTRKQIADILTKGSFSRERWLQLTQLFNQVTPHLHTCNRLQAFLHLDESMSKRQARPEDVRSVTKSRPVRILCAQT